MPSEQSVSPSSSERMQSITVRTRLRSADSPATCGAARGTGINVSSSTTDSTAAAGNATRSPAMVTTRSSSLICPSLRGSSFSAPRSGTLQSHKEAGAVVPIDAEVLLARCLGLGAQPDRVVAGVLGQLLPERRDDHIRFFVVGVVDNAISRCFDQGPEHVLHPWIPVGDQADELVL